MHHELTSQQQQAIELLISGKTRCYIAETLDIRRQTLWRWHQLPEFQEALRARRTLLREEMNEQLIELVQLSLFSVKRELARARDPKMANPLTTAFTTLKLLSDGNLPLNSCE